MNILFFQTSDPFCYEPMMRATSRTVIEFCRRSACLYESFIGLKRGFWPWQATFNRIIIFEELLRRNFQGWAVYLDADAYIEDLNFNIKDYLSDKADYAAIFASACATDHIWDVNAGICLINTAHPKGRELIVGWAEHFKDVSEATLREAAAWMEAGNDQDLLQNLLRSRPSLIDSLYIESNDIINSSHASFIRQHLRQYTPALDSRIKLITENVDRIVGGVVGGGEDRAPNRDLSPAIADQSITALYQGLLERDPDIEGKRRALAGLQVLGFADGIRLLASSMARSVEFDELRARR